MFNFGASSEFYFTGTAPAGGWIGELCYDSGGNCAGLPSISLWDVGGDQEYAVDSAVGGDQIIASVTPEPRSAVLLLTGIGLAAVMRKRAPVPKV
jgi:hypothetical protein